jgi:hypothetical protein
MPLEFTKQGIQFQYPENWTLQEDAALAGCRSVTVSSPEGAFWTVSVHPPTASPAELALVAVDAMREEYQELEVEDVAETVADHTLVGHDLNFYYLDLTNTAGIRAVRGERVTYTIFFQAEDREFTRVHSIFAAMTTSFLRNMRHSGY